jgi:hypothetical protein
MQLKRRFAYLHSVNPEFSLGSIATQVGFNPAYNALQEGVPKVFVSRWYETDFADLGRLSARNGSVRVHA